MVSTPLKNISQWEGLSHILWTKNMFQATNQKVFITANRTAIKKFLLPEASTCSPSWLVESPIIMLGSMAQNVGKYKVKVPKKQKIIQNVNLKREHIYLNISPKKNIWRILPVPYFWQRPPGRDSMIATARSARSLDSPFSSRFPHQRRDGHVHLAGGIMARNDDGYPLVNIQKTMVNHHF